MNEQLPIPLLMSSVVTLDQRAERIRDYVNAARLCIIETGRELIAAMGFTGEPSPKHEKGTKKTARIANVSVGTAVKATCEIAKVPPRYERLNGHDPAAFIWGANCERRLLTQGQKAMIGAVGFVGTDPQNSEAEEARKRGRPSEKKQETAKAVGVDRKTLYKAFVTKEHAPDLVQQVIDGTMSLNDAHEQADARKRAKTTHEERVAELRRNHQPGARPGVGLKAGISAPESCQRKMLFGEGV